MHTALDRNSDFNKIEQRIKLKTPFWFITYESVVKRALRNSVQETE